MKKEEIEKIVNEVLKKRAERTANRIVLFLLFVLTVVLPFFAADKTTAINLAVTYALVFWFVIWVFVLLKDENGCDYD